MDKTLHLLLISKDPSLRREVDNALEDLPEDLRMISHTETDVRRGIEYAVNRGPNVVVLELDEKHIDEVRRTATEISNAAADALIVVAYRPQTLDAEDGSTAGLIELMRARVKDFVRRPVSTSELEELLRRHFSGSEGGKSSRGRVVSFLGSKGGVGKSTLSLSVACELARQAPGRVLLIDASLQHGTMSELLDIEPEANICDAARQIDRLDERLLRMLSASHESGLRVLAAPTNAIDAAPIDDQAVARILTVARQAFDYVVVDTFPLIDSVTVAILDVADLAYVVLNSFVPTVLGTAELLDVLDQLGISGDRLRVVLNQGHASFRGKLRPVDVATRLGHDLDFVVPYSKRVLASMNTGDPYILRAPRWRGFGRSIREISRDVRSLDAKHLPMAGHESSKAPGIGANGASPSQDGSTEEAQALMSRGGETS